MAVLQTVLALDLAMHLTGLRQHLPSVQLVQNGAFKMADDYGFYDC